MAKRKQPDKLKVKASLVEREKYLARLEQRMLRGVTNQHELAAAFGKPVTVLARDMMDVRDRWLAHSPKNAEHAKITRIRQLEHLGILALDSYQRSRQDVEEITTQDRGCTNCIGTGKVAPDPSKPNAETKCPECAGRGVVSVETRKIKGQAGDASFLKMAKEAFIEAAKIEGVISTSTLSLKNLSATAAQLGDSELKLEATEITLEAPLEVLLRAKALLEEIHQGRKKGTVKVIENKGPSSLAETRKNEPKYKDIDAESEGADLDDPDADPEIADEEP